jgi:pyruvate/2-oxoglutarate dehydrogenase complex dihydrolipoamide dehydrogenase (E3) component
MRMLILGGSMVGTHAGNMIGEIVRAIERAQVGFRCSKLP